MNKKTGRYVLLLSVSYVLVMFGSRFFTLRFGQVFPERSTGELNRIAALDARIQELEARTRGLETINIKIANLEASNEHLVEEIEAAKNAQPQVMYEQASVPVITPTRMAKPVSGKASVLPPQDANRDMVHRGDSMKKVRRVFGRPNAVHDYGFFEVWYYDEYGSKSITFQDGTVSAWSRLPVEP